MLRAPRPFMTSTTALRNREFIQPAPPKAVHGFLLSGNGGVVTHMKIVTRPLLPTETEFQYQVYASTRVEELALVPWTPAQKEAFARMQFELRECQYQAEYPEAVTEVILCEEVPAGVLTTQKATDSISLVDVALLEEFRASGIGTFILRSLQAEGKKISLHVHKQNPAIHLYTRLGFIVVAEDSMYQQMEWRPQ